MYCYHCGKQIDERKIESQSSSFDANQEYGEFTKVQYICPRCGHLIHEGLSEEDSKELSRASHAQIQRANNSYARGMCMNALGVILLIIAIIFFILANKPSQGFVLQTNCAEFYVFIGATIISVILLGVGAYLTIIGLKTKHHYSQLLKDLNNKTFVQ
jgi:DNA-directed RNA polymerase subunit RPC12/RpoP